MTAHRDAAQPVELRPASTNRTADLLRRVFTRPRPRARVLARPALALGERLDVAWSLACPTGEIIQVLITLVGAEIARERFSSRTGISVVSQTRAFAALPIDRAVPGRGARAAAGRGSAAVPASTASTVAGAYNEIAWAVVVEATFTDAPDFNQRFPVVIRPVAP